MIGITDVWSAIRNACVSRLSLLVENFSIQQLEKFFNTLVEVGNVYSLIIYYQLYQHICLYRYLKKIKSLS